MQDEGRQVEVQGLWVPLAPTSGTPSSFTASVSSSAKPGSWGAAGSICHLGSTPNPEVLSWQRALQTKAITLAVTKECHDSQSQQLPQTAPLAPKSHVLNADSPWDGVWMRGLQEVSGSRGRSPLNGISAPIKKTPIKELHPHACHGRTPREGAKCEPRSGSVPHTESAGTWTLHVSLQNYEKPVPITRRPQSAAFCSSSRNGLR